MKKTEKYDESLKKLRDYLTQKEKKRQQWANEKWGHEGGRLFSIGRVAVPLISLVGMILLSIVCMVRFANIPEINIALANNGVGTNETAKEDPFIYFFFVLVLLAFMALVVSAVKFIKANYEKSTYILSVTAFLLTLFSLIRLGADQNIFPDNSSYDGGPLFSYSEYCIAAAVVFGILFVYSLFLVAIKQRDKALIKAQVERTLINIVPSKSKTENLLSAEDYVTLVDEYIKNDSQRATAKGKKGKRKDGGSTIFTDED